MVLETGIVFCILTFVIMLTNNNSYQSEFAQFDVNNIVWNLYDNWYHLLECLKACKNVWYYRNILLLMIFVRWQ